MKKNNGLFCCLSVRDFEPNVLIKGVHLTILEKYLFYRKLKGIHIVNLKKAKNSVCHRTTFYSKTTIQLIFKDKEITK